MDCQPSDGICFESQTRKSLVVPTIMPAEVMSTICVVCLNEIQNSEGVKEDGTEPLTLTSFNLLSCIGISAPEVPYDSLTLCNNCISFVNEWESAQEEISMLRSRCSQIKAKLLSLILQSTSKAFQDVGPGPASKVLRNAVSREYSARVHLQKLEYPMAVEEEDKTKHKPEESVVPLTTTVVSDEMPHEPDVRIEDLSGSCSSKSEDKIKHGTEESPVPVTITTTVNSHEMPHDPDVRIQDLNGSGSSKSEEEIEHEPEESPVPVAIATVDSDEMPHDPDVRMEDLSDSSSSNSEDEFQGHVIPGPSSYPSLNLPNHPRREQKVTPSLLSTIVSHLTSNSDRFDENSSVHRFALQSLPSTNKVTKTKHNLPKKKSHSWSSKKRRSKRRKRSQGLQKSKKTYSEISDLVEIDLECPEIDDVSIKMEPVEDDDDSTSQDKSYPFSDSLWSSLVPAEVKPDLVSLDPSSSSHHVVDDIENNSVGLNTPMECESTTLLSTTAESSTSIPTSIPVTIVDESWIKTEPSDVPPQCEAEL